MDDAGAVSLRGIKGLSSASRRVEIDEIIFQCYYDHNEYS